MWVRTSTVKISTTMEITKVSKELGSRKESYRENKGKFALLEIFGTVY
jgi:hypothetical protein